jgi:pimeloyl-ACP methyl ester carboxylesterase
MDSTGFAPLVTQMSADHTVVTYDPRGIAKSTRDNPDEDISPAMQADDVHRLIEAVGGGPVDFFGSSGGAVVGLALVQAHPHDVRTLVAHEPPVVDALPDKDSWHATIGRIQETYRSQGGMAAMQMFLEAIGIARSDEAPHWQPSPEQLAQMDATNKVFYQHLIHETTSFWPDAAALRAAPTRIIIGVGATSRGQLAHETGVALARQLGVQAVEFPGDHGGFASLAPEFAQQLRQLL